MKKHMITLTGLVLVVILGALPGGSTAQAATDSGASATDSGARSWSVASEQFVQEGIPIPIIESNLEGGFRYLGDGKFETESGRTFLWRDGYFLNPDGTKMDLPASAKDHLLSIGLDHQPNIQDMADSLAAIRAAAADEGSLIPTSVESWAGEYLHSGRLYGRSYNQAGYKAYTGNQATITVYDRSIGFQEYYGISLNTVNYPNGNISIGFELAKNLGVGSAYWLPLVHRLNPDYTYTYPNLAFSTAPFQSVYKTIKMGNQADGRVSVYMWVLVNGTWQWEIGFWALAGRPYFGPQSYIANYTYTQSAFEIASDSPSEPPHDPANHHSTIQTRATDGVWRLQNDAQVCSRESTWYRNNPSLMYIDPFASDVVLYPVDHWTVTNFYDWMARP